MDMDIGWWSILPPLITIVLAIITRQVLVSILAGIFCGEIIVQKSFFSAFTAASSDISEVFSAGWASMTLILCLAIGAVIYGIQASGGVEGFVNYLTNKQKIIKSRVGAQLLAYIAGIVIFIETTSTILISGAIAKPVIDKYHVSREKLAYICDSTSAPITWLVPFTSGGAFLMGMLGSQVESGAIQGEPLQLLFSAIPFQFYSLLTVIYVGYIIFTGKDWGPMKKAEIKAQESFIKNTKIDLSTDESYVPMKVGITPKAINMILPICVLIGSIFGLFLMTGNGDISRGDGTSSVYWGVFITIVVSGIFYMSQKICSLGEYVEWCINGMKSVLYIVIILACAFAFGGLLGELGTGGFLASLVSDSVSPALVPVIVFVLAAFMSFATGSSSGATSVFIPVAIPFAVALGAPIVPTIGAVVSGSVFGDHCSPISDTTILSSMISGTDTMDHYKTQIPYALFVGIISIVLYLVCGFAMT